MAYVIRDPLGPAIQKFMYNKKFRNNIKKYWPKMYVDGVLVMAPLNLWLKDSGVQQSAAHKKIYSLFDISVSDLEAEEYKGIDRTYLELNAPVEDYTLTDTEIQAFLADSSPLIYPDNKNVFSSDPETEASEDLNPDPYKNNPYYEQIVDTETGELPEGYAPEPQWDSNGWMSDKIIYNPVAADRIGVYTEGATEYEVLDEIKSGNMNGVTFSSPDRASPVLAAALLDVNGVLYQKSYEIKQKTLVDNTIITKRSHLVHSESTTVSKSTVLQQLIIEVRYRRIAMASDTSVDGLISTISNYLTGLNIVNITKKFRNLKSAVENRNDIAKQFKNMYNEVKGYSDSEISYKGYLRYDGIENIRATDFSALISEALEFGYDETPAEWWEIALVAIIWIIVIIVVIILAWTGEWMWIPFVLSIGAAAQAGLAAYYSGNGSYAAASYAGKSAQYLQVAAEYTGALINPEVFIVMKLIDEIGKRTGNEDLAAIVKIVFMIYAMSETSVDTEDAAKEVAKEGAKEGTGEAVGEGVGEIVPELVENIDFPNILEISEMSISELGQSIVTNVPTILAGGAMNIASASSWLRLLTSMANYYMAYSNPPAETDDLSKAIAAQDAELQELESPEAAETQEKIWSDPYDNYIDTNYRMQLVPQEMTSGLNAKMMNKYYTSGY